MRVLPPMWILFLCVRHSATVRSELDLHRVDEPENPSAIVTSPPTQRKWLSHLREKATNLGWTRVGPDSKERIDKKPSGTTAEEIREARTQTDKQANGNQEVKQTSTSMPTPKTCYEFTNQYTTILAYANLYVYGIWPYDEQRNECIGFNFNHSSNGVEHFQGMNDEQNMGAAAAILTLEQRGYSKSQLKAMTEDDQRNTLIVVVNGCGGKPVRNSIWNLQRKTTLEIAKIANEGKCCQ